MATRKTHTAEDIETAVDEARVDLLDELNELVLTARHRANVLQLDVTLNSVFDQLDEFVRTKWLSS